MTALRGRALAGLLAVALALPACGGGDGPVDSGFGAGRIEATVGPAGATLRGEGGTSLAGFTLEIPKGAVRGLVRVTIQTGDDLEVPGSRAAAPTVAITATPDPGVLLVPARLRMVFGFSAARDPADLFVAGRQHTPGGALGVTKVRPGLAAELGAYDRTLETFSAQIGALTDLQVRVTATPRPVDDANALVEQALKSLDRLTDESLGRADQDLAAALQADPFFPAARLLRAVTRVLVVMNDRDEVGPGLTSVGEALIRSGLDLRSRSLLRRAVERVWPTRATPSNPPEPGDVLEMLQAKLRPALEAGLADLAFVPVQTNLVLQLPGPIAGLGGDREIDAADVFALRASFAFGLYLIDALEDLVLTIDPDVAVSWPGDLAGLLARFPDFGTRRTEPAAATLDHLAEALFATAEAVALLNAETDAQDDDVIVFSASFDASKRDRWEANAQGLFRSFREGILHPLRSSGRGALPVDFTSLRGGLDLRRLLPTIAVFEPLAGTTADPTWGGLLPGTDQDGLTRLLRYPSRFTLGEASIVVDGDTRDWPTAAEALRPADAVGDAGELPNLDLARVFAARDGDDFVLRASLASGSFVYDAKRTRVYGFVLRPQRLRPPSSGSSGGGPIVRVLVEMTAKGPEVTVERDGKPITVQHKVAVAGAELELSLDRFDLFEPDEPTRDRVLRAFSEGLESGTGNHGGDTTRRILLRL